MAEMVIMTKGKDFYGKDIAEVIEQACKEFRASREELDIEVRETGSAGIFGLCKKKAHIRVQRKVVSPLEEMEAVPPDVAPVDILSPIEKTVSITAGVPVDTAAPSIAESEGIPRKEDSLATVKEEAVDEEEQEIDTRIEEDIPVEHPSDESLAAIQADLDRLLTLMGLPSDVHVSFEEHTVYCTITGPHEAHIVGSEGRTLDSLQYLLRKMVARHLPDRIMLALNAGDFRERRAEELKIRALEMAELVKADGKTQAIPALNPSERRVVHMVLQEDKGVRSRSVGEGLFKKVLIYKPGKGRRPAVKKRRGGQGGRPSGD
jgi:spoIIIJ-associated protein